MGHVFFVGGKTGMRKPVALPSGYTRLAYIQSSGTQYIDTLFKPKQNTKVVCDFMLTDASATAFIFCGRTDAKDSAFGLYLYGSTTVFYAIYGAKQNRFSSIDALARYVYIADKNTASIGGETYSFTEEEFTSSATLCLLARNSGGTISSYASARLYSCQVYDNDALIRDYVPCVTDDGEIGLFDMVNSKFYSNAGTGTFIGSEVA